MSESNLYAPPRADLEPEKDPEDLAREEDRRAHINAEYAMRGLGALWSFGALLCCLYAVGGLVGLISQLSADWNPGYILEEAALLIGGLGLALFFGKVGLSTRRLEPWTWLLGLCLAAVLLLGFPVGTLLGLYYIGTLLSKRGRRVFMPDYPELIRRTPHIKRVTPRSVWIILGVLVALGVLAFAVLSA